MKFVYPEFLYALSAISIPIIIHLFNFRRYKKVFFPNVKFLREVKEESTNRARLKHLLILASRVLAISLLVLAFAQPFFPSNQKTGAQGRSAVSIYLDNSFYTNSEGAQGNLLDAGRQYAYEVLNSFSETDRYQFISNSDQKARFMQRVSIETEIGKTSTTFKTNSLGEVLKQQNRSLIDRKEANKHAFIISGFSNAQWTDFLLNNDSSINYHLIQLEGNQSSNIYVDSIWFDSPVRKLNQDDEVFVRVVNTGNNDVRDLPLTLSINGVQRALTQISILANGSSTSSLKYTLTEPGWQRAKVELEDFPITHDNSFYFSYELKSNIKILVINESDSSKVFNALYGKDKMFKLKQTDVGQILSSDIFEADVIVLNGLNDLSSGLSNDLSTAAEDGRQIVVFPGPEIDLDAHNKLFSEMSIDQLLAVDTQNVKVRKIDIESSLYSGAFNKNQEAQDLPSVRSHYRRRAGELDDRKVLLELENGQALLTRHNVGTGQVYLWSLPLDTEWSNLSRHALFVVSQYQIATLQISAAQNYSWLSNNTSYKVNWPLSADDNLKVTSSGVEFIPEVRKSGTSTTLWFHDNLEESGQFDILLNDSIFHVASVNYSRDQSDLSFVDTDLIREDTEGLTNVSLHTEDFEDIGRSLAESREGSKLWTWMILGALLMLLIEILLIKLWKE